MSAAVSCCCTIIICVIVVAAGVLLFFMFRNKKGSREGPSIANSQVLGVGKQATPQQVATIVNLAGTGTAKAVESAIKKEKITSVKVDDFRNAYNKLGVQQRAKLCATFKSVLPVDAGRQAFSKAALAVCSTAAAASPAAPVQPAAPVKTTWSYSCGIDGDPNFCESKLCTSPSSCTQPTRYRPRKGVQLVGKVLAANSNSDLPACIEACDRDGKCDFVEMKNGTCVVKQATVPSECIAMNEQGYPIHRCSDGLDTNVTLYTKDGSERTPKDGLDKQVQSLYDWDNAGYCRGGCKARFFLGIAGGVLTLAAPFLGAGSLATSAATVALEVGVAAGEAVADVLYTQEDAQRLQSIQEGRVWMNVPPKFVETALGRNRKVL